MYIFVFFDISIEMRHFEFFIFYMYFWFVSVVPKYGFWIARQVNEKIYVKFIIFLKKFYYFFKKFYFIIFLVKIATYCNEIVEVIVYYIDLIVAICGIYCNENKVWHKPIASNFITTACIDFFFITITPSYNDIVVIATTFFIVISLFSYSVVFSLMWSPKIWMVCWMVNS